MQNGAWMDHGRLCCMINIAVVDFIAKKFLTHLAAAFLEELTYNFNISFACQII